MKRSFIRSVIGRQRVFVALTWLCALTFIWVQTPPQSWASPLLSTVLAEGHTHEAVLFLGLVGKWGIA